MGDDILRDTGASGKPDRATRQSPSPSVSALRASIPSATHIRNGRAQLLPHVRGDGVTWCGKKLVGKPEAVDECTETFLSYGNVLHVSLDPERGTCPHCRLAFDTAYAKAFPDGLKPIATFRADNPEDMERAKALLSPEALNSFFGPGGGGLPAFDAALRAQGTEAGTAETEGLGPKDDGPVPEGDAPDA